MNRVPALALSLALSPVAALADCPTAADLEKGIVFKIDTNFSELFRTLPSGVTEAIYSEDGSPISRTFLAKGVYLLELVDLENEQPVPGTRTTYAFPQSPADLPTPQTGAQFNATVAVLDRGEARSERQVYTSGASTSVTIGACSYEMFPITVTYPDDSADNSDLLHYLPALGIAYLASATYDGNTDTYDYSAIEAVK